MNEDTQADGLRTISLSLIELNEGQLVGLPQNPRSIKKDKYEKLKKSITDYPEMLKYRSLLVYPLDNGHFITIGGNMRFRALQELGYAEAPCIVIPKETSVDRLQAYTIQDNNEFGEWDWDLLANEWDVDLLNDWGFDFPSDDLLNPDNAQEDDFNENEDKDLIICRCKKGEIWQCGEHRVMCGDSTQETDVKRLMGGVKADITFTSPPYNASSINQKDNPTTSRKYLTYDDNKTSSEYLDFLIKNVSLMLEYSTEVFYNIGLVEGSKREIVKLQNHFLNQYKDVIYWEKNTCAPHIQAGVINNLVEFIICFGDGHRKFKNAQFSQGTYWNVIKGSGASGNEYANIHKATFPMYLPEDIIANFSPKNGSVIDCFGGTGTTLIACEQLGRKCYMMELDPHYCDVILARWEKHTGKTAIKIEDPI